MGVFQVSAHGGLHFDYSDRERYVTLTLTANQRSARLVCCGKTLGRCAYKWWHIIIIAPTEAEYQLWTLDMRLSASSVVALSTYSSAVGLSTSRKMRYVISHQVPWMHERAQVEASCRSVSHVTASSRKTSGQGRSRGISHTRENT